MSVAKNLLAGRIVEDSLFPYPRLRDKDREVLGMMPCDPPVLHAQA